MIKIKVFECAICKKLALKGLKGEKRFIGTRKDVRNHIRDIHKVKGRKNTFGVPKREFGTSRITQNLEIYEEY